MAFKKITDYKGIRYRSFPNENSESHAKKNHKWAVSFCESVLHRHVTGSGSEIKYASDYMKTLEKYAKGEQGNRKVKEKLLRYDKATNKFKGRIKDVFQTLDILPEMLDVIMAGNMKSDYKPQSMAVDEASINDRNLEIEITKFLIEEQTKSFLSFMGVKVDSVLSEEEIATFTSAQVDVLFKSGGIQLERERACVSVCNTAMIYSVHKEIENQNTFDAITYGICATKTYWDYNAGVAKYRYVDVKNLVVGSSKYNDFRDKTYCGEIRFMTLAEIISESKDITPEKIIELVYSNNDHNSDFLGVRDELQGYTRGENSIFDEYRIAVLDMQWLATDVEKYLQSTNSRGLDIYKKTDKDFRIKPSKERAGQSFDRKQIIKKYEAKWVIGTDILLNFDKAANVTYKGPKGAKIPSLDYNIAKTGKKSLVDRCRTLVDDINLAIVKLRSAIATIPPAPRMVIYQHALQNITLNGIKQSPKDLLAGLSEDGVLVVNSLDHNGRVNTSNGGKAVEFMNSGVAEDITIFSNEAMQKINLMRQVLGLPEGLDGTAGQKYQLASTMNLAANASSNALFPTVSLIGPLYEQTFDNAISITQAMCKVGDVKVKELAVSERVAKILTLTKDFSNHEFKIRVLLVPTEMEREMLMGQINELSAIYVQSQGELGCSKAEYLLLYKLIKAGLIDEAMQRIAIIEDTRMKMSIKLKQATIESNTQAQQESARITAEEARNSIAFNEAQKRTTAELIKSMEAIIEAYKAMLDGKNNSEGNSLDMNAVQGVLLESQAKIDEIKAQDQAIINPQSQEQEMMPEEQVM